MRHFFSVPIALAAIIAAPSTAFAHEAERLEPSSKWVLDYAPERCVLGRTFGTGDQSITLQIISYGDWNAFHTILEGPLVPRPLGSYGEVRVRFPGDMQKRDPVYALEGTSGTKTAVAFELYFGPNKPSPKGLMLKDHERWQLSLDRDRPEPDFDGGLDDITFDVDRKLQVDLHTENMASPLAALRQCVDDLYNSWGLDPTVQKSLSRLPHPLSTTVTQTARSFPPVYAFWRERLCPGAPACRWERRPQIMRGPSRKCG